MTNRTPISELAYTESVFQVGSPVPLNGVQTKPKQLHNPHRMVIILNSGLLHHVGSCGLSVRFARALAGEGVQSCRFDFSGIGDSGPRNSGLGYMLRMDQEVGEVMDYFQERHGIDEFVLYGLCSGAFASVSRGAADARVVKIVQIAPQTFRTPKWYVNHYIPKLISLNPIRRRLREFMDSDERDQAQAPSLEEWITDDVVLPTRSELKKCYRSLIEREVPLFVLLTRGEISEYNYLGQFREMLPDLNFGDLLEEHYFSKTRHIITEPDDQTDIIRLMVKWVIKAHNT